MSYRTVICHLKTRHVFHASLTGIDWFLFITANFVVLYMTILFSLSP
jgi:hypothetical protein